MALGAAVLKQTANTDSAANEQAREQQLAKNVADCSRSFDTLRSRHNLTAVEHEALNAYLRLPSLENAVAAVFNELVKQSDPSAENRNGKAANLLRVLENLGARAVPLLTTALHGRNAPVAGHDRLTEQVAACEGLSAVARAPGVNRAQIIDCLKPLLDEKGNNELKPWVTKAIGEYQPEASALLPRLLEVTAGAKKHNNDKLLQEGITAIGKMGAAAKDAVPFLEQCGYPRSWERLSEFFVRPSERKLAIRYHAQEALLRIEKNSPSLSLAAAR